MPFHIPSTRVQSPELERECLKHWWEERVGWTPERWGFSGAVLVNGKVVGVQNLHSQAFAVTKAVATGSWLGRQFQGRGVGKEMRAAALHLAFEGLGAEGAYSGGLRGQPDLPCRLALARLRGERCDHVHNREGERAGEVGLRLTRPAWEQRQRQDIEILGLDACRDWFGIASGGSSP